MRTWLGYIGPGIAATAIGMLLTQAPATEGIGVALTYGGIVYLVIAGPIYKRRWRARRRARAWYDLQRYKEPYQRRLSRTRQP